MVRYGLTAMIVAMVMIGCSTAPKTEAKKDLQTEQVQQTIKDFKAQDSSMAKLFDTAYGYAVFPEVAKGAAGIGGAHGRGQVFEQGRFIGYCDLSQATIGLQLGGQVYSELIFFQNKATLDEFKAGDLAFAAQASAVAAKAGASADADYQRGVIVFTMAKGGLMYEASIGGQSFDFVPVN